MDSILDGDIGDFGWRHWDFPADSTSERDIEALVGDIGDFGWTQYWMETMETLVGDIGDFGWTQHWMETLETSDGLNMAALVLRTRLM
jgi:hypothetical protein